MGTKVIHEWDVEWTQSVDTDGLEGGEVLDHDGGHTAVSALAKQKVGPDESDTHYEIVLVRDVVASDDDLIDRTWAYIKDGRLPTMFSDSRGVECERMPQRFLKEWAKAVAQR